MATAVILHAHPDDETIATGGTIAKAKRDGHRIVLVLATNGEEGEPVPGVLREGEMLGDRRLSRPNSRPRCSASIVWCFSTIATRA